jgi:nitroimidazol reductase NimA-like FMN-containing flavoprotein (pyridoxamine 5'-phosphate oxidase superfamily)
MARGLSAGAEALLTNDALVAHLATCRDGKPHSAPLWYDYRDGAVEIATTGRKLRDIRENPRVSLSVQKTEDGRPQWGLTIRGTATVVEDEEESRAVLRRINRRYGAEADAWPENTAVRIDVGSANHWRY